MSPAVGFTIEFEAGFAGNFEWEDGNAAAGVMFNPEPVGVESPVAEQGAKGDTLDPGLHTDRVVALAWQQDEVRQVAEPVDEGDDLGGQAATRAADCPIFSPSFAPLAFWWAVTMVPSIRAYSKSGSSDTRSKTSARTQRRKR